MKFSHLAAPNDHVIFNVLKSIWLWTMLLLTTLFGYKSITLELGLVSAILTLFTLGLGHSVGLHRGIIHKSFSTSKWMRRIFAFLAVQTGMGGMLTWLKHHYIRDYWQNRLDCPPYLQYKHNMVTDFFWNLHLTYVPKDLDRLNIPKEDLEDPWLNALQKYWIPIVLIPGGIVWAIWGFDAFIVLFPMRFTAGILGHWFIGFVCHKYGYSTYEIEGADNSGSNELLLGVLSFGEGFHNNHHAHPGSARMGIKWYEFDLGWIFVKILRTLGLIWNVNAVGESHTLKSTAKKVA